jgi:hypothetical protein
MIHAPVKFLTNKELLAEINRCKATFSEYLGPEYINFDIVVEDLSEVTPDAMLAATERKAKALGKIGAEAAKEAPTGLVVRLMTYDHIPLDPDRKAKSRATNKTHALVSFPPFKHYLIVEEAGKIDFKEVGRSHWTGGFENGHFTPNKGRMTNRMGKMFYMLVERYGRRANWRGYSYNDEMQATALVQLSQVGLQFNEAKSQNPFAFYTTTITNCFTRVFNAEKKGQTLRDDLLIAMGASPSTTRQVEHELRQAGYVEPKHIPMKRGRKPNQVTGLPSA